LCGARRTPSRRNERPAESAPAEPSLALGLLFLAGRVLGVPGSLAFFFGQLSRGRSRGFGLRIGPGLLRAGSFFCLEFRFLGRAALFGLRGIARLAFGPATRQFGFVDLRASLEPGERVLSRLLRGRPALVEVRV